MEKTMPRAKFLDLLRAFAIICVIATHYFHTVFPGASIGVSIFFAMSGYLITSGLIRTPDLRWAGIWRFWVKRFFRVYPALALVVPIAVALLTATADPRADEIRRSIPGILTFTHLPRDYTVFSVGILWTLYVEFWFYLLIPILVAVCRTRRALLYTLLAITVLSFCSAIQVEIAGIKLKFFAHILPAAVFPWFGQMALGAVVALLHDWRPDFRCSETKFAWVSRSCFISLVLIALFVANDDRSITWPLESYAAAAITAFWVFTWTRSNGGETQAVVLPFIGRISYSLYLVHAIPIDFMGKLWWPSVTFLHYSREWAWIGAMVIVATLMHFAIELPFIRLGKWLTSTARVQAVVATSDRSIEAPSVLPSRTS